MKNYNKVLIIYNPNAMKGEIDEKLPYIKQRLFLRYSQVDSICSPTEQGLEQLTIKNAPLYDIIVACGGDGTVNRILNGVAKSEAETLVAILPYGTSNDIARTLNVPFELDKAIDCILRLNFAKYDLMYDGSNYITSSLSGGYLTTTIYSTSVTAKKRLGKFAYVLSALKHLFKFKALPLTVTCDGERVHDKFLYFLLMNSSSVNGFNINKKDDFNNGKVRLVLIKKGKFLGGFFSYLKLMFRGVDAIKKHKLVYVRDVRKVEIENHSNTPFIIDGEKTKFLKAKIQVSRPISIVRN